MLGEIKLTERGFERINFTDSYGVPCSLQQSSAVKDSDQAGASFVWLGPNKPDDEVDRMHLDRNEVEALVEHLVNWLNVGSFKGEE